MRRVTLAAILTMAIGGLSQAQISQDFIALYDDGQVTPATVGVVLVDHEGLANVVFDNFEVEGLDAFVGRPKADARTGGANANQDIGDVTITYSDGGTQNTVVYPADPGAAGGPLVSSNNTAPAALGDGFTRVAYSGEGSTAANIAWDTAYNGSYDSMVITFPIRIDVGTPANDNADGFGFSYVRESVDGASGSFYSGGEEPSASGLGVGFDIWENSGEGPASLSLHHNGALLQSVDLINGVDAFGNPFVFEATENGNTPLESGEPLVAIITVVPGSEPLPEPVLIGGSEFIPAATRSAASGGLQPAQDGNEIGEVDGFYRLSDVVNDQGNYITFDSAEGAGSRLGFGARTGGANQQNDIDSVRADWGDGTVDVSFDFRITKEVGEPADGLSMVLARTSIHGDTGEVSQRVDQSEATGIDWTVAENPLLGGSLGLAFKTYQDDELRVRYDGVDIATIADDETLVDGEWHNAVVQVQDQGADALVTIILDETNILFSDLIPGAAGLGGTFTPDPCDNAIPGDTNFDGMVNAEDLNTLGVNWQMAVDPADCTSGDFNNDAFVDAEDLNTLGVHWQEGVEGGAAAVPEPNAVVLTLAGMLGLLMLRRRG